ncbi:hypothetical protein [Winogradskya humida]|uniref:LigA protein n=1 Tax=Winogradskya humida TaxID=113566 RepID=A0ABQ3ZMI0_9ACTN|nr:hypothetical protein [Actinoplanes humidus]GIE19780.1 hypothetical protein Ahu01nite_028820 [Actinoplanes humidus]
MTDPRLEVQPELARLHGELLRLAGRVPGDLLARARLVLADGDTDTVAELLDDVADVRSEPPFSFEAGPGETFLDLTSGPLTDELDRAAVRALARVPEAVALWRSWRVPAQWAAEAIAPVRVYVAETATRPDLLPAVSGVMMRALDRAGLADPQVETYPSGVEPPPYQVRARSAAALLWTAGQLPAVRVARVFDRGGAPGPRFDDDHELLDGQERDRVLAYLTAGTSIMATTQRTTDIVEPSLGAVVPMSYRTDGRWVWTDTAAYYLRVHGLAPDAEQLADIRAAGYAAPATTPVDEHRALAALFRPQPATAS